MLTERNKETPQRIGILLIPHFSMMGLLSAVEPLRAANRHSGREVFRWEYFSETGEPVEASNGMSVVADARFDACQRYPFMIVCASYDPLEGASPVILNGLRRLARGGSDLGSIDSGAFVLAKAGLLQGRKVAMHWETEASFQESFPDVEIFSGLYWVDGNLCSSAGGTASIDMMGQLIRSRLGDEIALAVSEQFMHGPMRNSEDPQRLSKTNRLQTFNGKLLRAVTLMEQNVEDPMALRELSRQAGISERQMQRLFQQELGVSPASYYQRLRLAHARDLLQQTGLSVTEIANASGFGSAAHFSRAYRQRYERSPREDRRGMRGRADESLSYS
ncbi:GlxA family transcriptional regulator [Rhodovibrionaceae bacterium A322]